MKKVLVIGIVVIGVMTWLITAALGMSSAAALGIFFIVAAMYLTFWGMAKTGYTVLLTTLLIMFKIAFAGTWGSLGIGLILCFGVVIGILMDLDIIKGIEGFRIKMPESEKQPWWIALVIAIVVCLLVLLIYASEVPLKL